MKHFPRRLHDLPPFDGPFDVDGKETRYGPGDWYHLPARAPYAAGFEVETSEIEFWFKP